MAQRLGSYGAQAAIASGVLMMIATAVLLLFFALEAPALIASGNVDTWTPLGRTNDGLVGLSLLVAIPLPFGVHASWRQRAPGLSTGALALALASLVVSGLLELAYFGNLVTTATQLSIIGPAFAGVGLWLAAISLAPAESALTARLRWFGAVNGIGLMAPLALFIALGGTASLSNPQAVLANPLLVALVALGTLSLGVGYPIWAIWFGRGLSRSGAPARAPG